MNDTLQPPTFSSSPQELRLAVRINDACAALGISRSSLYELMATGEIRTAVVAGRRLIPVSELERLLSEGMKQAA
jgi:excisionase family DNA binding protein